MKQEYTFWVVGGDLRQVHLAQLLAQDGWIVRTYALERGNYAAPDAPSQDTLQDIGRADCVIFPLPVCSAPGILSTPLSETEHPLEPILAYLRPDQLLCGGRLDANTKQLFSARALTIHDYFAREELIVANAVPTAEGALQLAMEELPITIHGARVLVIGYGRVGKLTAQRFAALGARVDVAARSYEQLAWAGAFGLSPVPLDRMEEHLPHFDLVINTVPARTINREALSALREDSLIIDLASRPGGVDMDAAAQLGRRVIWALSLPGKVAPITAGACIRDTIYNILHQAGI